MPAVPDLDAILRRPDVWRGNTPLDGDGVAEPAGAAQLDDALGGGWPQGALTELLVSQSGVGEISLLLPALTALSARGGWLAIVAPPLTPYAPAAQAAGVALERLLVLDVAQEDAPWCYEQILASGAFAAALAWLPKVKPAEVRRLQLAVDGQRTVSFLFRPAGCASQPSAAPLRIALDAGEHSVDVRILKRRGAPLTAPITVPLPKPVFKTDAVPSVASPSLPEPAPRSVSEA